MRSLWLQQAAELWCCLQQEARVLRPPREGWDGERRHQEMLQRRLHHGSIHLALRAAKSRSCARNTRTMRWSSYGPRSACNQTVQQCLFSAWPGAKKAECCGKHAQQGMVNVTSRRCAASGCSTTPSYGESGGKTTEFCTKHKHLKAGLVNVIIRECAERGCTALARYRARSTPTKQFCRQHAEEGMIHLSSPKSAPRVHNTPTPTMNLPYEKPSSPEPSAEVQGKVCLCLGKPSSSC